MHKNDICMNILSIPIPEPVTLGRIVQGGELGVVSQDGMGGGGGGVVADGVYRG